MTDIEKTPETDQEVENLETVEKTTDEPQAEGKNKTKEYIESLQGKLKEKDEVIEQLKSAKSEAVKEAERKWASKVYGKEAFESEEYQAVAEKYPDMDIEDQMKLTSFAPQDNQPTKTATPGRPRSQASISQISQVELAQMQKDDPAKFKETLAKVDSGQIKLI